MQKVSVEAKILNLWILSLSPLIISIIVTLKIVYDASNGFLNPNLDHCLAHPDEHFHLCLFHKSSPALSSASFLFCALPIITLIPTLRILAKIREILAASAIMKKLSTWDDRGFYVLPVNHPLAFNIGFWASCNFISKSLLKKLKSSEVQMILSHERSHQNCYDNIAKLLLSMAWISYPLPNKITADLYNSMEVRADFAILNSGNSLKSMRQLFTTMTSEHQSKQTFEFASYFSSQAVELRLSHLAKQNIHSKLDLLIPITLSAIILLLIPNLLTPAHHWLETSLHQLLF
ncbi:M48 family metalloprotease [bacterium]|nr:M48 family metalloprotease [bacterium]